MNNTNENLIYYVNKALDELYFFDKYLIENNTHERSVVFSFGYYLKRLLASDKLFEHYNVDIEYNTDSLSENNYKAIIYENKKYRIIPDVIIHKRGSNNFNLLVIEFKKSNNNESKNDFNKLKVLTCKKSDYDYKLGLFIKLGKTRNDVKLIKFVDGKSIK